MSRSSRTDRTDEGSLRILGVRSDASVSGTVAFVDHRGTAACLCFDLDRKAVLLVQQHRPVLGETLWEIPSGRIEDNETPEETARRELLEETGFKVQDLELIAPLFSSVGLTNEIIWVYGATSGTAAQEQAAELTHEWFSLDEALSTVRGLTSGAVDAKTQVALEWCRERFRSASR